MKEIIDYQISEERISKSSSFERIQKEANELKQKQQKSEEKVMSIE